MQMQISTGCNITGDPRALAQSLTPSYATTWPLSASGSSMIEQHLFERNATKSGFVDKRCLFEVRLAGQQPFISWDVASSDPAHRKMAHLVDAPLEKLLRH